MSELLALALSELQTLHREEVDRVKRSDALRQKFDHFVKRTDYWRSRDNQRYKMMCRAAEDALTQWVKVEPLAALITPSWVVEADQ